MSRFREKIEGRQKAKKDFEAKTDFGCKGMKRKMHARTNWPSDTIGGGRKKREEHSQKSARIYRPFPPPLAPPASSRST